MIDFTNHPKAMTDEQVFLADARLMVRDLMRLRHARGRAIVLLNDAFTALDDASSPTDVATAKRKIDTAIRALHRADAPVAKEARHG